eukprot:TRINITY_DN106260_c0_g1_i1.p1 TRINITY_DN106260_c0_g1~~TRINITY_DN106260_c0_g1_i1.p1  ORF type:complete len:330 (+),score=49.40 TRINITY_DN106260_c0_g1_i1:55-990(+)
MGNSSLGCSCSDGQADRSVGNNGSSASSSSLPFASPREVIKVQIAATEIVKLAGISAYHTSVILGGREYYFATEGMASAPPLFSHRHSSGRPPPSPTQVISVGGSMLCGNSLTEALRPFFMKGSYDVLHKNCNSFTDAALFFLTGRRLDARFTRLERLLLAAEPISSSVIDALVRAFGATVPSRRGAGNEGYAVNPVAVGFSVDNLVELWRTSEEEATSPKVFVSGDGGAAEETLETLPPGLAKLVACGLPPMCCGDDSAQPCHTGVPPLRCCSEAGIDWAEDDDNEDILSPWRRGQSRSAPSSPASAVRA